MAHYEITRGDDWEREFTATRKVDPTTEVIVDLTGASIWFTVKLSKDDADPGVLQRVVGSGITITDAIAGKFKLALVPANTNGLAGSYYYDIQVVESSGRKSTPERGVFVVNKDVTRA